MLWRAVGVRADPPGVTDELPLEHAGSVRLSARKPEIEKRVKRTFDLLSLVWLRDDPDVGRLWLDAWRQVRRRGDALRSEAFDEAVDCTLVRHF